MHFTAINVIVTEMFLLIVVTYMDLHLFFEGKILYNLRGPPLLVVMPFYCHGGRSPRIGALADRAIASLGHILWRCLDTKFVKSDDRKPT